MAEDGGGGGGERGRRHLHEKSTLPDYGVVSPSGVVFAAAGGGGGGGSGGGAVADFNVAAVAPRRSFGAVSEIGAGGAFGRSARRRLACLTAACATLGAVLLVESALFGAELVACRNFRTRMEGALRTVERGERRMFFELEGEEKVMLI